MTGLHLAEDGAQLHAGAAGEQVARIEQLLCDLPQDRAGVRIGDKAALGALVLEGGIGGVAHRHLGRAVRPVRAILFDKSAAVNWGLAWHQDRTIAVREKREVPGFGPWTRKAGMLHVAPPFSLLARMITMRIHLDAVDAANAPLLIAPGSHLAKVAETAIGETVAACGTVACLAERGDVWAYATPILHASEPALQPKRRRVLQLDFAAEDLPGGLEWLGV